MVDNTSVELTASKKKIRELLHQKRIVLSKDEIATLSSKAANNLLASSLWKKSGTIFLTVSDNGEIDTKLLLEEAWKTGRTVGLPRCLNKLGAMDFFVCTSLDGFERSKFGLREPLFDKNTIITQPPDLAIFPGMAFTRQGVRLGMGGGYYDRYFSRPGWKGVCRVGYCYEFQIVPELPIEPWDLNMHALCTENSMIYIDNNHS